MSDGPVAVAGPSRPPGLARLSGAVLDAAAVEELWRCSAQLRMLATLRRDECEKTLAASRQVRLGRSVDDT